MSCTHLHSSPSSSKRQLPSTQLQHSLRASFLTFADCFAVSFRIIRITSFVLKSGQQKSRRFPDGSLPLTYIIPKKGEFVLDRATEESLQTQHAKSVVIAEHLCYTQLKVNLKSNGREKLFRNSLGFFCRFFTVRFMVHEF